MLSDMAYQGIFILGDTTWELVQAYSKTMQENTARNNAYFWPVILLLSLAIAIYYIWRRLHPQPPVKEYTVYDMTHPKAASSPKKEPGREMLRVPVNFKFNYALIKTGLPEEKLDYVSAQSIDLSGSGISFVTKHEVKVGDSLRLKLEIEPGKPLSLLGQVIRTAVDNSSENHRWIGGIEFVAVATKDSEAIIQWIFRYQRDSMT